MKTALKSILVMAASVMLMSPVLAQTGTATQQPATPAKKETTAPANKETTAPANVKQTATTQQKATPEQRAKALTDKMKSKLNLSDTEYSQIYDINLKYAKQCDATAAGAGKHSEKAKQLRSQMTSRDAEYKKVLTAEQYKEYEKISGEVKSEMTAQIKHHESEAKAKNE